MQEKNRSSSQFSQRTENLAEKMNLLLRDLPQVLGFSERMLFGYRSGKYPITNKAWRKLEQAERTAGIVQPQSQSMGRIGRRGPMASRSGVTRGDLEELRLEFNAVIDRLLKKF